MTTSLFSLNFFWQLEESAAQQLEKIVCKDKLNFEKDLVDTQSLPRTRGDMANLSLERCIVVYD
jgi:hypothetical protein